MVKPPSFNTESQSLSYSKAQAERGHRIYLAHCVLCHGVNLSDAQFGAPLKGAYFQSRWRGRTAADLFLYTQATMPPEKPMTLAQTDYIDVTAYILQANNLDAGGQELPTDAGVLRVMQLPW